MSASIGGGLGLEPMTVHAAHSKHGAVDHSATLARLIKVLLKICQRFVNDLVMIQLSYKTPVSGRNV